MLSSSVVGADTEGGVETLPVSDVEVQPATAGDNDTEELHWLDARTKA